MGEEVGQRFAGHGFGLTRLDIQPFEQFGLEVLADLVRDGPLVPLLGRLRTQINLRLALAALGPATLRLSLVEADDHAELALRQRDRIDGRSGYAGCLKQFLDHLVDDGRHVLARNVV